MKKKTQRMLASIATVVSLGTLACILAGCGTARTYTMPYAHAEEVLFEHLHLNRDLTLCDPRRVQARADDDLVGPMSMKLFAVDLHENIPGQSLSFTCHHLYDIGAEGGQYIRFDLNRESEDKTRVTVDYCDRWWGM